MSSRADRRSRRPSLSATVLRLAGVAMIAAVLVWSVLFADLLREGSDAGKALAQPRGQEQDPEDAPAPVTTRTS